MLHTTRISASREIIRALRECAAYLPNLPFVCLCQPPWIRIDLFQGHPVRRASRSHLERVWHIPLSFFMPGDLSNQLTRPFVPQCLLNRTTGRARLSFGEDYPTISNIQSTPKSSGPMRLVGANQWLHKSRTQIRSPLTVHRYARHEDPTPLGNGEATTRRLSEFCVCRAAQCAFCPRPDNKTSAPPPLACPFRVIA